MTRSGRWAAACRPHLLAVAGFTAFFAFLFSKFYLHDLLLSDSDLYEYFLPLFLSPIHRWSSYEFGGLPAFADPGNYTYYPPHMIFGWLVHSWTALAMSAYVLAALFTYAYVFHLTRSRSAAVLSALAYSASEALLERLAHFGSVHAIAWVPLIALALDRVRGPHPRTWVAIGAFGVASAVLAGHPQPAIYAIYALGLYALAGILAERAGWRALGWTTLTFTLGGLATAVTLLPLAEASQFMARQSITFERFVGRVLTAPQTLSFLFPTVLHGETREVPTYVGLVTLLFALISLSQVRRQWRVAFWASMALLAVALGLGTATPLADIAWHVPLYHNFRNIGRHLFLFAFGASVLAGFGLAALQRGEVSRAAVVRAVVALLGLMTTGGLLMAIAPGAFEFEVALGAPGPGPLAFLRVGVWVQFAIALVAAGAALLAWRTRAAAGAVVLLVALLGVDLLNALPYDVGTQGLDLTGLAAADAAPSVHAAAIARLLAPTSARALALGGTDSDEVIPAAFARVWRIPIAGGYGPMLLNRYSTLAMMGTNGEVRSPVLRDTNRVLDLLAVRAVLVEPSYLEEPDVRALLDGSPRWRETMRFRTSRTTDRGTDQSIENETEVRVYENTRALPRAWFVSEIVAGDDDAALNAAQDSVLPDGRTFDPHHTAVVEAGNLPAARSFPAGSTSARLTQVGDGHLSLAVSTEGGGFLVVSENFYPGWRARIDGDPTPLYRTDLTLQGLVVPPGTHRVDLDLESTTLRTGGALSILSVLACAGLFLTGRR